MKHCKVFDQAHMVKEKDEVTKHVPIHRLVTKSHTLEISSEFSLLTAQRWLPWLTLAYLIVKFQASCGLPQPGSA